MELEEIKKQADQIAPNLQAVARFFIATLGLLAQIQEQTLK